MTEKEYIRRLGEVTVNRRNVIIKAVNMGYPKQKIKFKSEVEERYFDNLVKEADKIEEKNGYRPKFEFILEEIEWDDPRLDIYRESVEDWAAKRREFKRKQEEHSTLRADEILDILKEKWESAYLKAEWKLMPGWERRVVTTEFMIGDKDFSISYPKDSLNVESYEDLQREIECDLNEYNATEIYSYGYTRDLWSIDSICKWLIEMLIGKWMDDFKEAKEEWDKDPGWEAKLVEIKFNLYGLDFSLIPESIGLTGSGWDQGFMETVQGRMRDDLKEIGATDIYCYGFID